MRDPTQWLAGVQVAFGLSVIILAVSFYFACRGRLGLLTGVYWVVVTQPAPNFELVPGLEPVAGTYIFGALIILAGLVYVGQHKPAVVVRSDFPMLFWLGLWVIWMAALLVIYPPDQDNWRILVTIVVLRIVAPVTAIALFGNDFHALRQFAWAYILANFALLPNVLAQLLGTDSAFTALSVLFSETWRGLGNVRFNYHVMGQAGAVTGMLCLALLADRSQRSRWVTLSLILASCIAGLEVITSSSRQYIVALLVSLFILAVGFARERSSRRYGPWLAVVGSLAVIGFLYSVVPTYFRISEDLFYDNSGTLSLASRVDIFNQMWAWFLRSPLFGNGLFYENLLSHDIFLDALAGQGILGFIFLCGFLWRVLRYARGTWITEHGNAASVWRMIAFTLWVIGLMAASVSGSVLSADVMYFGSALIWRLSTSAVHDQMPGQLGESKSTSESYQSMRAVKHLPTIGAR